MFIESLSLPEGADLHAQVVVVGAGPTGLILARELARARIDVLLLEAGGMGMEPCVETGRQPAPTATYDLGRSHYRGFGGSSQAWLEDGWRARPMDPIDFRERRAVPGGAWPFGYEALVPYLERAQAACGLPTFEYEYSTWRERVATEDTIDLSFPGLRHAVFFRGDSRYFSKLSEEVQNEDCLRVVLDARATRIHRHGSGAVESIRARSRDGFEFRAFAHGAYVLAAGGIDTPRLMLSSNVGNDHDLVGRYFQEHIHTETGFFQAFDKTIDLDRRLILPTRQTKSGSRIQIAIGLSEETMEQEGLQNATFWMEPARPEHTSVGFWSIQRTLAAVIGDRRAPEAPLVHATNTLKSLDSYASLVRGKLTGRPSPRSCAFLTGESEQRPDPRSRVVLTDELDAYGMPIPKLEWKITDHDIWTIRRTQELLSQKLAQRGIGVIERFLGDEDPPIHFGGGNHHMGTTRMHEDPRQGVVDADCRVHSCDNLFIAGSSVFPSSGSANPSLTAFALAVRLADHLLERVLERPSPNLSEARVAGAH